MSEVTAPIMTDATGQSIDGKLNSLLGKMDNLAAAFQPNASGIVYSNTTSGLTGNDVQEAIDEMAADVSEIKQSLSVKTDTTVNAYICYKNVNNVEIYFNRSNMSFASDGKTLNQVIPSEYRPSLTFYTLGKIYNGSTYVDCLMTFNSDGTVVVSTLFNGAISGAQLSFLSPSKINYIVTT